MKLKSGSTLQPDALLSIVWEMLPLISRYLVWAWIALAHIALAVLALLIVWWTETTPSDVAELARSTLQSKPVAAMTFLGVSFLSVATGYWRLLRWTHAQAGSWLIDTVLEKLRTNS
ncbi:hypothetical protein L3067_01325 [Xanthomonas sp. PPL568]|uniref:hypothetical protein n=1 Tax=Xanthomonas indica TaxID=2912242 RepID=UPI001F592F19|nr:hypothetical protein [Xanthomonas indica]MCI2243250.1 hypothetical protein [Xanthomonas indica]